MKPVKQLYKHNPPETYGDCHRAAIASILELPCEDVPHFNSPELRDNWQEHERKFLLSKGIVPVTILFDGSSNYRDFLRAVHVYNKDVYWLLGGTSRNNVGHTVVVLNQEIIHDPAIDDSGIVGPLEGYYWGTFLGATITHHPPERIQ